MHIHTVESSKDLQRFIAFPYLLYKQDPIWIPPLRSEQKKLFNPKTNPFLQHCTYQLFLLMEDKKVIGRIAAFIDTLAVEAWNEQIGLFGHFECINNKTAASLLLETAKQWLTDQGCIKMRGPWSFVSQEWGTIVEGFEHPPVVMSPYNPQYYNELLENFGLHKAKDLLCWNISIADGYKIPHRVERLSRVVAERYGVRVRQVDMDNLQQDIQAIMDISNESLMGNWGYSPVTNDEVNSMARDMKPIIHQKGVLFAEDKNGRPIGYALVIPDVNHLLKGMNGRLFPFGFVKLLRGIPRLTRYRMFALGVIPEFQRKAVDGLLYHLLNKSLNTPDLHLEINYVLEDNWPMVNAIKKLEAKPLRRYRVYEMRISENL